LLQRDAVAVVPLIWWFEIRNAATLGIRRKRIDEVEMGVFFNRLDAMVIDVVSLPNADAIFTLARRHNLTFYDAAYLELAQREKTALATLDRALARAAVAETVPLIGG
jgi:predicted nucleic acid-binding protein